MNWEIKVQREKLSNEARDWFLKKSQRDAMEVNRDQKSLAGVLLKSILQGQGSEDLNHGP